MLDRAYVELYGNPCPFTYNISYSGRFKGYNANAERRGGHINFRLSRKWETVGEDIKIGLIQELLIKLHRKAKRTQNMELYSIFLQKVHVAVPKTKSDFLLESSFNRVNNEYFNGMVEKPNLAWGKFSTSKLGSYDFGTDQVTMSYALHPDYTDIRLLDYVMYHEILHKDEKFRCSGSRTIHHSKRFREREKMFRDSALLEKALEAHIKRIRIRIKKQGSRKTRPTRITKPKGIFQRILEEFAP